MTLFLAYTTSFGDKRDSGLKRQQEDDRKTTKVSIYMRLKPGFDIQKMSPLLGSATPSPLLAFPPFPSLTFTSKPFPTPSVCHSDSPWCPPAPPGVTAMENSEYSHISKSSGKS